MKIKLLFYMLGILIYAVWINLGSAIGAVSARWHSPNTFFFILLTMGLLLLYAHHIARVLYLVLDTRSTLMPVIGRGNRGCRLLLFLSLSLGLLTILHVLLVAALLSQHKGYTIFNTYFRRDFWFFFIPLLIYCLYLYRHPRHALFTFRRMDELQERKERLEDRNASLLRRKLELKQENERLTLKMKRIGDGIKELEKRESVLIAHRNSLLTANADLGKEKQLLQDKMNELQQQKQQLAEEISLLQVKWNESLQPANALLRTWQQQRSMPALLAYIRSSETEGEAWNGCELALHQVVICQRKDRCYFVYTAQGEKQLIPDSAGRMLTAAKWLVKVSNAHYLNMLYCENKLVKYHASDADKGDLKMAVLDPAVRTVLEAALSETELDSLLEVSRRLRIRFCSFWEISNLRKLDESGLFIKFRIAIHQVSISKFNS